MTFWPCFTNSSLHSWMTKASTSRPMASILLHRSIRYFDFMGRQHGIGDFCNFRLPQSQRSSPLAEENRLKLTRTYLQISRYFLRSSGVCCGDMEIWRYGDMEQHAVAASRRSRSSSLEWSGAVKKARKYKYEPSVPKCPHKFSNWLDFPRTLKAE